MPTKKVNGLTSRRVASCSMDTWNFLPWLRAVLVRFPLKASPWWIRFSLCFSSSIWSSKRPHRCMVRTCRRVRMHAQSIPVLSEELSLMQRDSFSFKLVVQATSRCKGQSTRDIRRHDFARCLLVVPSSSPKHLCLASHSGRLGETAQHQHNSQIAIPCQQ